MASSSNEHTQYPDLGSKHHFPVKVLLEKVDKYRIATGKTQNKPWISFGARGGESAHKRMGAHRKNTETNLKELPMAKPGTIWATKYIVIVLDCNPKYKVNIQETMDINK